MRNPTLLDHLFVVFVLFLISFGPSLGLGSDTEQTFCCCFFALRWVRGTDFPDYTTFSCTIKTVYSSSTHQDELFTAQDALGRFRTKNAQSKEKVETKTLHCALLLSGCAFS